MVRFMFGEQIKNIKTFDEFRERLVAMPQGDYVQTRDRDAIHVLKILNVEVDDAGKRGLNPDKVISGLARVESMLSLGGICEFERTPYSDGEDAGLYGEQLTDLLRHVLHLAMAAAEKKQRLLLIRFSKKILSA